MPKFSISERQRGRAVALLLIGTAVIFAGYVFVLPSLRAAIGSSATFAISVALAVGVMSYSVYFAIRWQRGLDEVESAGSAFATTWGALAGQILFVVALMLPPFHTLATDVVGRFMADSDAAINQPVVTLAMVFAFASLALLQSIATIAVHLFWLASKR